jgi:ABC-type multidrug transport system ATPase subunit
MRIAGFSKTYGTRTVLAVPDFDLPAGEITAVIGPNGSGKSTLARLLAGLEHADARGWTPPAVRLGYMPQRSFAFRLSTARNITLNGRDPERARELMRSLGLEHLARQRAKKLSGGETARMALARLLMGRYELLILDEPTAALDMESTLAVEELLRRYTRETGCALLLITHSLQQARRLASQVLFLQGGVLIEAGPAGRVLNAPREEATRRFLDFYGI